MNKIGFDIRGEKTKTEESKENVQTPGDMNFKDFLKSPQVQNGVDITTTTLKFISEIGNGVLIGALWAACTAFPAVGIPLKICAGVSCVALHEVVTNTTNKIWNRAKRDAMEVAEELLDVLDSSAKK